MIDAVKNFSRVLETKQQRTDATLFLRWKQMMPARNRARALTESLEAKYFAPNRTDEFFAGPVS